MLYRLLFATIVLIGNSVYPATVHVPQDQPTIQMGIGAANYGDTVLVSPGTYVENLTCNKGICLISTDGPTSTIIRSAAANTRILTVTGSGGAQFVLSGFTLTGALNAVSAIMIARPGYLLENNHITGNQGGSNLTVYTANGKVLNNKVWSNSGGDCSGIYAGEVDNVEIAGNELFDNSGALCAGIRVDGGTESRIHHNLIYRNTNNSSSNAAVLNVNGSWLIYNNTIVNNASTAGTAAVWLGNSSIDVRNNIVVNNQNCFGVRAAYNAEYNNVWGNQLGDFQYSSLLDGNLTADPMFRDALSFDYRLSFFSPCRNAGDPDLLYIDIDGSRDDMGALEYFPESFPVPTVISFGDGVSADSVGTSTPEFFWTYSDTAATTQAAFEIEVGTDGDWSISEMWQPGPIASPDTSVLYSGAPLRNHNTYFLRLRLNNGQVWGEWLQTSFRLRYSSTVLVPGDLPTIQSAVNAAKTGDSIVVASGQYLESVVVDKPLILFAPSGPESTFLAPLIPEGRALDCFAIGTDSIIVVGFNISGANGGDYAVRFSSCNFRFEDNHVVDNLGLAAIYSDNSGGRFRNNEILRNQGVETGGILIQGYDSVIVEHNVFADNTSPKCGALLLANPSLGSIRFNEFYRNSASSEGFATVINANGFWKIFNNTVALNTSSAWTAAVWIGGSETEVRNNIVAMNNGCYGIRSAINPAYNDAFENSLGNFYQCQMSLGNVSVDPLFTDGPNGNFELQDESPCRDIGDPSPPFYDPDGTRCDIGARPYFAQIRLTNVRLIGVADPEHLTDDSFVVGWSLVDELMSAQDQFEIAIGTDDDWTVAEIWSPPVFTSADSVILYSEVPLYDGQRYWVRVRAHGAMGWSNWGGLTLRANSKPDAPFLSYPYHETVVGSLLPLLTIQNATDAEGDSLYYTFLIIGNYVGAIPDTVVVREGPYGATTIQVEDSLMEDQHYFWKVRASDYFEESAWSETFSFMVNIGNTAPQPFGLLAPQDGFTFAEGERHVSFSWQSAFDPDPDDDITYELHIATDSDFEFIHVIQNIDATRYTLDSPLDWRMRYWWKVKAIDIAGAAVWSSAVFKFRMMTPGDVDGNLSVNISDVVHLINYIFAGGPPPIPLIAGDADCTQFISISDAVYMIQFIFNGGPQPCDPGYQKDTTLFKSSKSAAQ